MMMSDGKRAGLVVDKWKQGIFSRHLKQAGFEFEEPIKIDKHSVLITVTTRNIAGLQVVIQAACDECKGSKGRVVH